MISIVAVFATGHKHVTLLNLVLASMSSLPFRSFATLFLRSRHLVARLDQLNFRNVCSTKVVLNFASQFMASPWLLYAFAPGSEKANTEHVANKATCYFAGLHSGTRRSYYSKKTPTQTLVQSYAFSLYL